MTTWSRRLGSVSTSTYLELADELEELVRRSEPDERLPSENEIVEQRSVSRVTARSALQELERRSLVRRVRGRGTFVARRLEYVVGAKMAPSWSATVRAAGGTPGAEVLGCEPGAASPEVARLLEIGDAEVYTLRRRGYVDGLVATSASSAVPVEFGAASLAASQGGSLHAAFRELGLDVHRAWSRAELVVPGADVAEALGYEGRPPTWLVESLNRDRCSRRAVEYSRTWMRADVFRLRLELGPEHPDDDEEST